MKSVVATTVRLVLLTTGAAVSRVVPWVVDKDAPRRGRPSTITPVKIQDVVRKTTQEKPSDATHWSTRSMAKAAGLSEKSVRRIWHKHGLKPHLSPTFKVSNDPKFAEKLEAIIGTRHCAVRR